MGGSLCASASALYNQRSDGKQQYRGGVLRQYKRIYSRLSNSTWVIFTTFTASTSDWTRFTTYLDYHANRWELYACDSTSNKLATTIATNLAFQHTGNASVSIFRISGQQSVSAGYVDDITIANNTSNGIPLNIDRNGDGIADRWELQYYGSVTNISKSYDSDGDGWSDYTNYIAGINPLATSHLQIVSVDLSNATSSDISISILGGGSSATSSYAADSIGRYFTLVAMNNNATNASVSAGSVGDGLTGPTSGPMSTLSTSTRAGSTILR